ncbi:hypothetical protein [Thermogemmatispora sp.]|uniref:hypothetical protein n=1 Tax=Thermogemmatispora sp. TaxID=1968838 RepID=UPI001D634B2B|nr:hypothetical protein [Thermogemmatispora sp.]MBX5450291.1 hypothetical protein [Thermogemmatispora sp.]
MQVNTLEDRDVYRHPQVKVTPQGGSYPCSVLLVLQPMVMNGMTRPTQAIGQALCPGLARDSNLSSSAAQ